MSLSPVALFLGSVPPLLVPCTREWLGPCVPGGGQDPPVPCHPVPSAPLSLVTLFLGSPPSCPPVPGAGHGPPVPCSLCSVGSLGALPVGTPLLKGPGTARTPNPKGIYPGELRGLPKILIPPHAPQEPPPRGPGEHPPPQGATGQPGAAGPGSVRGGAAPRLPRLPRHFGRGFQPHRHRAGGAAAAPHPPHCQGGCPSVCPHCSPRLSVSPLSLPLQVEQQESAIGDTQDTKPVGLLPEHPGVLGPPGASLGLGSAPPGAPTIPGVSCCRVCCQAGAVVMCDLCERCYHLDCHLPALQEVPRYAWSLGSTGQPGICCPVSLSRVPLRPWDPLISCPRGLLLPLYPWGSSGTA